MATLDNCDSASGFTATSGTIVADTGTYNSSPASLLMTLSNGQNWCDFYKSFTYQDSTSFSFYYNIPDYTYYDYAEIYFSAGGSDYFYKVITPTTNGWQQITFTKASMLSSGSPNWATVNTWGIYFQKSSAGYPSMYFDTFEYTPASVSISATVINIDVQGIAPSVSVPVSITAPIANVDIQGIAPTISIPVNISCTVINIEVQGIAPSLSNISVKTNWTANDYLNYTDMNRIDNNINYVKNLIATFRSTPNVTGTITNRDNKYIEFADTLNLIESNILALEIEQPINWITPKTNWQALQSVDYNDLNRIESNIYELYVMVNNIITAFKQCGASQSICGSAFQVL